MIPLLVALLVPQDADLSALAEKEPRKALPLLADLASTNSLAKPWVHYAMLRAYLKLGKPDSAEIFLDSLGKYQLPFALRRLFDHYLDNGMAARAAGLGERYEEVVLSDPGLCFSWARSLKAAGKSTSAKETFTYLVRNYPRSRYADRVKSETKLAPGDQARLLYYRGKYKDVVKLLAKEPPSSGDAFAFYLMSKYRLKEYQAVVDLYRKNRTGGVEEGLADGILERVADSYRRLDRPDDALEALFLIKHDPETVCREASFVILASGRDSAWKAERYRRLSEKVGETGSPEALAWLGLLGFALGDGSDAADFFMRALDRNPDLGLEGECYYWLYRATGDGLWKARLLSRDPVSFYAMRLRPWIPLSDEEPTAWAGLNPDRVEAEQALVILARLGLSDAALDWVLGTPEVQWEAAGVASAAGNFLVASKILTEFYRNAPARDTLPRELIQAMYPFLFWDQIKHAADTNDIEPALLIAVAREESRFDPDAVSPAGAKGIVQLMPGTAKKIGKKTGYRYSIFDVKDNLFLGSYHLRERLDDFGATCFAVAAYNGGPNGVKFWMGFMPGWDDDLFCEFITFDETRLYTKQVMKSYYIYRWLEETQGK